MRSVSLISFVLLLSSFAYAQINLEDSTAQVIGFWDRGEKQSYAMSFEKYKVKGSDTTDRYKITYDVDVTVKDSTEKSYTIEWFYQNHKIDSQNKLLQKIGSIAKDVKVLIKTDEMGTVQEVINWKEVKDYIGKAMNGLKKELKGIPNVDQLVNQMSSMYATKESIETNAIHDINQFYFFHGAKYKKGEKLNGTLKTPNGLGGEPFDSEFTIYLDDFNVEENNYIVRSLQVINTEQLTEATYNYIVQLAKKMNQTAPAKNTITVASEIETASRIHSLGWVIYSFQTKTVTSGEETSIEERIMEIK